MIDPSDSRSRVCLLIGSNRLQNELLSSFLEANTEFTVSTRESSDPVAKGRNRNVDIALFDCSDAEAANLWAVFGVRDNLADLGYPVALFNFTPDLETERDLLFRGVRGVFYQNEPLTLIPKGLRAIISGEIWFPRRTLMDCVMSRERTDSSRPERPPQSDLLTPREREILVRIAGGACNKEIADDLFISLNTVKTHLYNIYRKININNRLQATLWAAKNM